MNNEMINQIDLFDQLKKLALFAYTSDMMPRIVGIVASRKMYRELTTAIIHAPMAFFDRTPNGRILARFSKDMENIDSVIPEVIRVAIYCFFEVISYDFVLNILCQLNCTLNCTFNI